MRNAPDFEQRVHIRRRPVTDGPSRFRLRKDLFINTRSRPVCHAVQRVRRTVTLALHLSGDRMEFTRSLHETVVLLVGDDPSLLAPLLAVFRRRLPQALAIVDPTIRWVTPGAATEAHLDLLLASPHTWLGVEIQLQVDDANARRWPLMVAVLHDSRKGTFGTR